jgi:hypothetical protein
VIFCLDPLSDPRWSDLVSRHPRASVFHMRDWLDALHRTYGYTPFALTTTERGPLQNGLVLCRVRTWASRRLVSLPFSDHCEPLVDDPGNLAEMLFFLKQEMGRSGWRSLELRAVGAGLGAASAREAAFSLAGFAPGATYHLHVLDLARPLDEIFSSFHPSHTQRAIHRAEREGLEYEAGRSPEFLSAFYGLLRLSRRRHGLPPQPLDWFRNLLDCLGGAATIHLARKDGLPSAALLTTSFRRTLVYKYGGSDAAHHHLGSMPLLFWRVVERAQAAGFERLDLGRSDPDQPGLIAFKEHLGAVRSTLTYCTWPEPRQARRPVPSPMVRRFASHLPDTALDLTGRLLYRHLG